MVAAAHGRLYSFNNQGNTETRIGDSAGSFLAISGDKALSGTLVAVRV